MRCPFYPKFLLNFKVTLVSKRAPDFEAYPYIYIYHDYHGDNNHHDYDDDGASQIQANHGSHHICLK